MRKITVVGAGHVGESVAHMIAVDNLCEEIALVDVRNDYAKGVALDIYQSAPVLGFNTRLYGSADPSIMVYSDLVVITAGVARKPGMTRMDVLNTNIEVVKTIVDNIVEYAPESKIIVVTNPVDILTYYVWKRGGFELTNVMGQAGILDSSRMAAFIAREAKVDIQDVSTMVLGCHGDSMLPIMQYCNIRGYPLTEYLSDDVISSIVEKTRNGGAEILSLRQNSSAYIAPGAAVAKMVNAIANDTNAVLPCISVVDSYTATGLPCILNKDGAKIVQKFSLTKEEMESLQKTMLTTAKDIRKLGLLN